MAKEAYEASEAAGSELEANEHLLTLAEAAELFGAAGRDKPLMTMAESAAFIGVGRDTMYRLVASGQLRRLKLGKSTRIARTDLEALCERLVAEGSIRIPPYRRINPKRRARRPAAAHVAQVDKAPTATGSDPA
jgi:excisionase family DNA binding protein